MEKARSEFINTLIAYKKISSHDITVVFDGYKGGYGSEHSEFKGGVKVIYSRLGEKADDVIKRIISRERKEWIVVSSDRDIMNHAWASGSIPIASELFFEIVQKKTKFGKTKENAAETEELNYLYGRDGEDESARSSAGGNPQKPSKKERAMQRALRKL
jgi:predicted RNA-binding protein with PIN domain